MSVEQKTVYRKRQIPCRELLLGGIDKNTIENKYNIPFMKYNYDIGFHLVLHRYSL